LYNSGKDSTKDLLISNIATYCPKPGIKYGAADTTVFITVPKAVLSRPSLSKKSY
jgi:hypothetical protein